MLDNIHMRSAFTTILHRYGPLPLHDSALENAKLLHYVQQRRFAAANRHREYLLAQRIDITPEPNYEEAALNALRIDNTAVKNMRAWIDITPNATEYPPTRRPYGHLQSALLDSGKPAEKLDMIHEFGLAISEKGYMDLVLRDVVPLFARFASRESGGTFFADAYQGARAFDRLVNKEERKRVVLANKAIDTAAHAGWHAQAVQALWDAVMEDGLKVPVVTYERLKMTLSRKGQDGLVEAVEAMAKRLVSVTPHEEFGLSLTTLQ